MDGKEAKILPEIIQIVELAKKALMKTLEIEKPNYFDMFMVSALHTVIREIMTCQIRLDSPPKLAKHDA